MKKILFIDDELRTLDGIRRRLHDHRDVWNITFLADPREAVIQLEEEPFDAIFTDFHMPHLSGFDILKAAHVSPLNSTTPVVFLTGSDDAHLKRQALELGAADLLNKPVEFEDLLARLNNVLRIKFYEDSLRSHNEELERKVRQRTRDLEYSRKEIVLRLAKAAELRDKRTGNHVLRVASYARQLAIELGKPHEFVSAIFLASPLHDIGKIAMPDDILRKRGMLTSVEREIMQEHCQAGERLLSSGFGKYNTGFEDFEEPEQILEGENEMLKMAARIALCHHEKWDGTGYPSGLIGRDIPLEARIVAIANVFDALTTERPYKMSYPAETALEIMREQSGKHFDPTLFEAFENAFDKILKLKEELIDEDEEGELRVA